MPIAIIIDWYGPYFTKTDFRKEMRCWNSGSRALYMGIGKGNVVNYIGLTSSPSTRFNNHKTLFHEDNVRFFCGEITSQGIAGKGRKGSGKHRPDLKIAEHALIAKLNPKLNTQLKFTDTDDCVVLYSRFFDVDDFEKPVNVLKKFPRLFAYNSWADEWTG